MRLKAFLAANPDGLILDIVIYQGDRTFEVYRCKTGNVTKTQKFTIDGNILIFTRIFIWHYTKSVKTSVVYYLSLKTAYRNKTGKVHSATERKKECPSRQNTYVDFEVMSNIYLGAPVYNFEEIVVFFWSNVSKLSDSEEENNNSFVHKTKKRKNRKNAGSDEKNESCYARVGR